MASRFYSDELVEVRHRRRVTQSWNQVYTRTLGMRINNLNQQERSSLEELRRQRGVFMSQYSHHLHNVRPRDLIELSDPYLRMRIQPCFSRGENLVNNINDVGAGKLHPPGVVYPSREPPSLTVGHRDIGSHYKAFSKHPLGGNPSTSSKEWKPIPVNSSDSNLATKEPKITVSSRWKRSSNMLKGYSALRSGLTSNDAPQRPLMVIGGSNYSTVVRTPIAMTQRVGKEQFKDRKEAERTKAIGTIWEDAGREGNG